jgi:LCP family protein required for cell wall assembly
MSPFTDSPFSDAELERRLADALGTARTDSRFAATPWPDGPRRIAAASRRKRLRTVAASVSTAAALVLVTMGAGYAYVSRSLHDVQHTTLTSLPKGVPTVHGKGSLASKPKTGQPFTVLILGTDSRSGTGSEYGSDSDACHCSDTIMLARVDPQTSKVSLLSIPRDSRVTIANTGSLAKLNSAFADGPDNSVATIEKAFGIPINHWVVLDLAGFKSIVDAIGGIRLDVPTPIRDKNAGLSITSTGCQTIDGNTALAISRARELQYYDSATQTWKNDPTWEYGRQRREQIVMRVIAAHTAKSSLSNPITAAKVINTFTSGDRLAVDSQVSTSELIDLAGDFAGFDAATMQTFSLPTVTTKIGQLDYEVLQTKQDEATITAWYDAVLPAKASSAPATTSAPAAPTVATTTAGGGAATTRTGPAAATTTAPVPAASTSIAATATTATVPAVTANQPMSFDPRPCS